jgi:hypothetical protein
VQAAGRPSKRFPPRPAEVAGSSRQRGGPRGELIDGLVSRHENFGALSRRDDGLMGDVSPVGDLRLHVLQNDEVRYRVVEPGVKVVLVVREPPPDPMSRLIVVHRCLKVARSALHLRSNQQPQVKATGITRHQEKISPNVMGCVLDRTPAQQLKVGFRHAGARGSCRLLRRSPHCHRANLVVSTNRSGIKGSRPIRWEMASMSRPLADSSETSECHSSRGVHAVGQGRRQR